MTTTNDTRTEAERLYDMERSGELYVKAEPPAVSDADPEGNPLLEAARWLDRLTLAREADRALAAAQPANRSPLFYELKAWIGSHFEAERLPAQAERDGSAYVKPDPTAEQDYEQLLKSVSARVVQILCETDNEPLAALSRTIRVDPAYHDLSSLGDICSDASLGPLAFTDYDLGEATISIQADGTAPEVLMFGHDSVPLDRALQAIRDLATLLADPRVQAGLAEAEPPSVPQVGCAQVTAEIDAGGMTFRAGSSAVYFDPGFPRPQLAVFSCAPFEYDEVEAGLPDLIALMADPRVKAAREAQR